MSKLGRSTKNGSNPTGRKSKKRTAFKTKSSSSAKSLTRRRPKQTKMGKRIIKNWAAARALQRVIMRKT